MKKLIIAVAASLVVLIGGGTAYVSYTDSHPVAAQSLAPTIAPTPTASLSPSLTTTNDQPEPGKTIAALDIANDKQADGFLKSALDPKIEVYEEGIIGIMHHMTHQKVEASDKWTNVQITPERISLVHQIVEMKGNGWVHKDELLIILNRWNSGDFSKIDKDHNYLWNLEGGSIGKATGILSAAEEKAFIEKNFK